MATPTEWKKLIETMLDMIDQVEATNSRKLTPTEKQGILSAMIQGMMQRVGWQFDVEVQQ